MGNAFADGTSWTIAVAPNGTSGGYIETVSGASTHAVAYSAYWPDDGYVPVFYVHCPKGSFAVTSANTALQVSVRDMTTGTTLLASAAASSFAFTAPQEGWYRWALSGGTAGVTALADFTVTATTSVSGNNINVWLASWRSAPSLHLNGFGSTNVQMPEGNAFDWAYDEVLLPVDADFLGTYVESLASSGWYIGIQNNGGNGATTNRTVIFSAWDAGDTDSDPTLADFKRSGIVAHGDAESVTAERFGGEGTGTHILLNGNLWQPGTWVRFLVNTRPEQITLSDGTTYDNTLLSAWYMAEGVDTEWHYIGTMREAGRINYINPSNAFLEEFTRYNTSQGNAPHKAYYRRIFTRSMQSGKWYNRNSFWWGHTDGGTADGARNDIMQTAVDDFGGEPAMYMQSGGYLYNTAQAGGTLIAYREPDGIVPDDATLQALLDRDIAPAMLAQEEQRMQLAVNSTLTELGNEGWTVTACSSQETAGEGTNGRAAQAVDGDATTYWHTQWAWSQSSYPHSLTLLHDGDITIDQVTLSLPSGRSTAYSAKTVKVSVSDNGTTWAAVGTYSLDAADTQTIAFASPVTTSRIRFDFTEGNGQRYLVIGEIAFYQKNLEALKALAQSYVDAADTFNGYDTTDWLTATRLSAVSTLLASTATTSEQLTAALTALAADGRRLKYGELSEVAHISAERAYYISNAVGYGALVAGDDDMPTLRNAAPAAGSGHASDCLDLYRQAMPVQTAAANWRILTSEEYPGRYYIYNIGARKYLSPAYHSTLSSTPVPVTITRGDGYFVLSAQSTSYKEHTQVCAAPQFAEADGGPVSMWNNDDGGRWLIYDNYALTPDLTSPLTALLRQTATTEAHRDDYAATGVLVSMSSDYTTYASTSALDFSQVQGLDAYAVTAVSDAGNFGLVALTPVAAAVPAQTGLLLHGEAGDHEVPYATGTTSAISGNKLVGVTAAATVSPTTGSNSNFILMNGYHGTGFYPITSTGTLAAGRAYLSLPTADADGFEAFIISQDGIRVGTDLMPKADSREAACCDLAGRTVSTNATRTLRRGIYIVRGQKIVVQ